MPNFRKKPLIIEAKQLFRTNREEILHWCGDNARYWQSHTRLILGIIISTIEGDMFCQYGDWIIKGIEGEFYPCKADIFEKTYELVETHEVKPSPLSDEEKEPLQD